MKSKVTADFRKLLRALPKDVRKQARAAYTLFKTNPYHPSLHFKQITARKNLYSARVGMGYRVLGWRVNDDLIVWAWIGTHGDYDKLLKS